MATEITTRLIDDLDGGPASRTVVFTYNGSTYELDLADRNVEAFEDALRPYVSAARRRTTQVSGKPGRLSKAARQRELQVIRDWARTNGYAVSDRGRIPSQVVEAYEKATSKQTGAAG